MKWVHRITRNLPSAGPVNVGAIDKSEEVEVDDVKRLG